MPRYIILCCRASISQKTQERNRRKTKIIVFIHHGRINRCASYQHKQAGFGLRSRSAVCTSVDDWIIWWHWAEIILQFIEHNPYEAALTEARYNCS